MLKILTGLLLGLAIGILCQKLHLPLPAPPVFSGSFLVVAMTLGYWGMDKWMSSRQGKSAVWQEHCGGPTGQ